MKILCLTAAILALCAASIIHDSIAHVGTGYSCPDEHAWIQKPVPQQWILEALK